LIEVGAGGSNNPPANTWMGGLNDVLDSTVSYIANNLNGWEGFVRLEWRSERVVGCYPSEGPGGRKKAHNPPPKHQSDGKGEKLGWFREPPADHPKG